MVSLYLWLRMWYFVILARLNLMFESLSVNPWVILRIYGRSNNGLVI
jgi:hypothetical protein